MTRVTERMRCLSTPSRCRGGSWAAASPAFRPCAMFTKQRTRTAPWCGLLWPRHCWPLLEFWSSAASFWRPHLGPFLVFGLEHALSTTACPGHARAVRAASTLRPLPTGRRDSPVATQGPGHGDPCACTAARAAVSTSSLEIGGTAFDGYEWYGRGAAHTRRRPRRELLGLLARLRLSRMGPAGAGGRRHRAVVARALWKSRRRSCSSLHVRSSRQPPTATWKPSLTTKRGCCSPLRTRRPSRRRFSG